jgi:cell division protease FtsH
MPKFQWSRGWIAAVATLAIALVLLGIALTQASQPRQTDLSTALADVKADIARHRVDTITIDGSTLTLDRGGGQVLRTGVEQNFSLTDALKSDGIAYDNPALLRVNYTPASPWSSANGPLLALGLIAVLIGGVWYVSRRAQGGSNPALAFGKARARLFAEDKPSVTFSDVEGVDEAKQELHEIVEFLKYPQKFAALGARVPKGVLLSGPPGTGKTLVSRAVAGEAGVPFFSISASEFVEMFVGVGASRVRDLFAQAKKVAPAIIFVDEIDAVGRQRGTGFGGSHDEREQTLNQLLVEMDGFDQNTNVIVMAATNRADALDAALLRPGRFDRQVILDRPDARGRAAILRVHARNKPVAADADLDLIARQTAGFSGADLQNLLNEAAILTARANESVIGMHALEEAMDRVVAGPARKSRVISEREKAITAYHEIGHALVARLLPHCDPVHKVSIVARGQMGGYTRLVSEEERSLWSKSQFRDFLAFALGGHAAEKLIFGEVTTGASNDIERVTAIARKMVMEYGMSEGLGPVRLAASSRPGEPPEYSEETARAIDVEVRAIVQRAMATAERLLEEHRERLVLMSERLIERETLEGSEFSDLFDMPLAESAAPEPRAALSTTSTGHGLTDGLSLNLASGDDAIALPS